MVSSPSLAVKPPPAPGLETLDAGAHPDREVGVQRVALEVVGHLLLAGERPGRRGERHPGQAVVLGGAVELQGVPLVAPVVADALVAVDDEEGAAEPLEVVSGGEAGLAGADDQRLDVLGGHDVTLGTAPVRARRANDASAPAAGWVKPRTRPRLGRWPWRHCRPRGTGSRSPRSTPSAWSPGCSSSGTPPYADCRAAAARGRLAARRRRRGAQRVGRGRAPRRGDRAPGPARDRRAAGVDAQPDVRRLDPAPPRRGTAGTVAVVLAAWPVSFALVHRSVLQEERRLAQQFGQEFTEYRTQVPRYVRLPGPGT